MIACTAMQCCSPFSSVRLKKLAADESQHSACCGSWQEQAHKGQTERQAAVCHAQRHAASKPSQDAASTKTAVLISRPLGAVAMAAEASNDYIVSRATAQSKT